MNIQVSDADIAAVAAELGLDLDDPEKVAILEASESCDIQAGPGSGKTTMLAAKLAILAKKWPSADRGILVLSHTNVARREIEARLSQSKPLRQLLGYPHFIGTFQSFVDQFLALPFLRQQKIEVTAIDDDKFSARALSAFAKGPYWTARAALGRRSEPLEDVVGKLRFDGAQLEVTHPAIGNAKFPRPNSKTGKELARLKCSLAGEGYFRYEDMYAFSEACLAARPYVAGLLCHRFPWVFVDELQDTNASQDRIVESIFGGQQSTLQRFGDRNQAIFDFNDSAVQVPDLFARRTSLPLSATYRFGNQIAKFASAMTVVEPQKLRGLAEAPERKHTIFVFARDKIASVVPAFAGLVLAEVPTELRARRDVCVVGSRKNVASGNQANFPLSLGDYWSDFRSDLASKRASPDSLLGFVFDARDTRGKEGSLSESMSKVMCGLMEVIRRSSPEEESISSRSALRDRIVQLGCWAELKTQLWQLLRPDTAITEQRWNRLASDLIALLNPLLHEPDTPDVKGFLNWSPPVQPVEGGANSAAPTKQNVLVHKTVTDGVRLRFDSIHAVKGETHAATLVVETYINRTHDIKSLLPVLCGNKSAISLTGAAIGHGKRLFVGITRPSELVCLAVFAEHITDKELQALERGSWCIEMLS